MSRPHATRSRLILFALTLAALQACTAATPTPPSASGTVTPTTTASPSRPAEKDTPTSSPTHVRTAPPATNRSPQAPRYEDRGHVGAMATAYLRKAPARELLVEIDYVEGQRPSDQAVRHLKAILGRETDKPGGVSIRVDDDIPEGQSSYTFAQIEALEARHRDAPSGGARAVLYVLYLNGDLAGEAGTLGVAYRASGVALFQERIRSAATSLVHPGAIERAVLTHEAGHVLGLINIGYQSRHDHEDPEHPKHSRYKDSVMYWAIEDVSVVSLLSGGPPADFDRFDRADLAMRRN